MLGLCCYEGLSLVVVRRNYSLVAVSGDYTPFAGHGLLTVVASLVARALEHRINSYDAQA